MSFKGDLRKLPLADVFQSIHQNGLTGALSIRDRGGERLVSFSEGFVAGCVGTEGQPAELADELVRRRVIDSKDVSRPSRFFRRRGSLKRALKRRKILDSGEFNSFTRQVILERIYECFLLEDGSFEFLEDFDATRFNDDEQSAAIRIAPGEILMEAMRRVDEWKRIRRAIPSFREVYVATREPTEEDATLDVEILSITAAGEADLEQVLGAVPASRFAACEALLALVEAGSLRVATGPEYLELGRAAEQRGDLDKAAACFARGLHYERGNAGLNERRIGVLERLGRKQEAADERKLFAGSLLELGDKKGAAEQYAAAAGLAPADPLPRERLLELQVGDKDREGARKTADELVELYLRLGLGDSAKSVFPRVLLLSPKDVWLRTRMAETHAKLHENATAARIYRELAEEALDRSDERAALGLLRKSLDLSPDEKTRAILQDVEAGTHAEKRRRRQLLTALAVALVFFGIGLSWAVYESMALSSLRQASREGLVHLERGPEGVLAALGKLEAARAAFPYTRAAAWSDELAVGLCRLYVREARLSDVSFELAAPPEEVKSADEIIGRIARALEPGEGKPSLEGLVAAAEEALALHPPGAGSPTAATDAARSASTQAARDALLEARARIRDVILPAMDQASANLRLTTEFRRAVEEVRALLPRVHVAWGRVSLSEVRAILDAEVEHALRAGRTSPPPPLERDPAADHGVTAGAANEGS